MSRRTRFACAAGALLAFAAALLPAAPPGAAAAALAADSAAADRALTLSGRVTDAAGAPIAQVSIGITELRRGALSGDDGRYAIPALPAGTYHVSFQRLGFAPAVHHFTLGAGRTTLDVVLEASLIELPGTQVSAGANATTPLESPQPVSVLAGEALRQAAAPTLGATLERLPGLRNWSTGSGIGKPSIRGLRADRVVIAANDLRLDNQQWGDEHGPQIESADIERIEVIRGPASVLYGSDALGGVVNVIPKPLPVAFGAAPFAKGRAFGAFASGNDAAEGGVALEGAAQGLGFRGSFTAHGGDDVRTPGGRLANSASETATGSGAIGLRGARGSVDLAWTRRGERIEIHEDPEEEPDFTGYQKITDDLVRLSAIVPVGGAWRLELNTGAERNLRREFEDADDAEVALGLEARTLGGTAQIHHPAMGPFEGLVGISYQHHRFTTFGEESLIPESTGDDFAVFAFEESETGPWRFALGARFDGRTLDVENDADLGVTAQTRDWNAVSGNVGVLYRITESVALVANGGRGFRAPSNFDLFSNGVHEGTVAFERGNPDLKVETSLNGDLALRVQAAQASVEVGGFVNAIHDFIYSRPTGTFDPGSGFEIFETVQGDARLAGFEATAELHPERHLHLSVTSDFVRGENTGTGEPLPWIPPWRVLYGVRYEPDAFGGLTDVYVGVRGETVAEQTRLAAFDTAVPGYTLAHAEAGCALPFGGRALTLDLGVRNLFDRTYRDFMSRYKAYADAPGRSVTARVTAQF